MLRRVIVPTLLTGLLLAATLVPSLAKTRSAPLLAQAVGGAAVETTPVPNTGDAADDPAIWLHPTDLSQSTVIGTDKLGGLAVYSLNGAQIQYRADGNMNNVDLRYNFSLGGQAVPLVSAGNTSSNSIALYTIDPSTRLLAPVAARTIVPGISIYGSCMYHSPRSGKYFVFLNSKGGSVEQWELFATSNALVDARRVRTFAVGSKTEGCVADDQLQALYISEEAVGIWRYDAEPDASSSRVMVDSVSSGHVTSNIEGLALYYTPSGGYLLASSQGSDDFAVYQRTGTNAYVGSFSIAAGNGIDRVSNTDGIDVSNAPLGGAFAQGLFIAQDGSNDTGNQNFKLVPWAKIAAAFSPALTIDTTWDARTIGAGSQPTTGTPSPTMAPSTTPAATSTLGSTAVATPQSGGLAFVATDDTYLSESAPSTSYGSNSQLQVVGGTARKRALLRFTVSGVPTGSVVSAAKLRLYVTNASTSGGMFYTIPGVSWSEATTWNDLKDISGSLFFTQPAVTLNSAVEIDVTSLVVGNGTYNLAILAPANNTDTLGYASSEASTISTRPQLLLTLQNASGSTATATATASSTPTETAAATSTATATASPNATPDGSTATATASATPSATATATGTPAPTPAGGTRIKDITYENGNLTDASTGADRITGAVTLESSQPLQGSYAARFANVGSAYLQEDFTATDTLYVSFLLRLQALPSADVRIALISNAGVTVGNLYLRPTGALRLRNDTVSIGSESAPLAVGTIYRIGLRQSRGSGANAQLQAYLVSGTGSFGTPFASLTTGSWQTPADRIRVGATISSLLNATVDDIRLDSWAMP